MLTALVFILILAILIIVHELGHFWAARKFGVKVEEFSIGFPPRIWKKQKGETQFSVGAVPLGGFVKIFGEDDNEQKDPRAFATQTAGKRALMLAAGVLMNLLLAYVLLSVVVGFGVPTAFEGALPAGGENPQIRLVEIQKDSPAQLVGLQVGDGIQQIAAKDGTLVPAEIIDRDDALDLTQKFITAHKGQPLAIVIMRGSEVKILQVTPRAEPPQGQGPLGIAMLKVAVVHTPWYLIPWEGLKTTGRLLELFGSALGGIFKEMFTQGRIAESVSGPVGIVKITSQTLPLGWLHVVQLMAILSLNLAIINVLPFPALDGGRLLFLAIEKIRGKPLQKKVEQWANTVGFAILILFMLAVTIKDVGRFF